MALVTADRLAAYSEARQRQQDAHNAETFAHWGRVARAVARLTGKRIGLDTATRMTIEADFGDSREPATREYEPRKVDPIDELKQIVSEQRTRLSPRQPKAPANSIRRKRPERRR